MNSPLDLIIDALFEMDERPAAKTLLDAFSRHAFNIEQYDELAKNYFKIKKFIDSVNFAEKALAQAHSAEQIYICKENLANSYAHAFYPEKALEIYKQLEIINPNDSEMRLKKAYSFFLLGRLDEAESILRAELKNPSIDDKTRTEINFNLGTYELYKDNFYEGLYRFLIYGRKMNVWKKPRLPFKEWDGATIKDAVIVIRAEAGIGDEFINIRFMKHIKDRGMTPIFYTDRKDLSNLYDSMGFPSVSSVDQLRNVNDSVYWCHSMDIPVILRLEYKDLWYGPYLKADKVDLNTNKINVGIRWEGNPNYDNDLHRSINPIDIVNAIENSGIKDKIQMFSLQRDTGMELMHEEMIDLDAQNKLDTWESTLSYINSMDLIITSCTSIAHAAAALGKRTIVFSPMSSYYVWCHSKKYKHSPWYGENVSVLRQKRPRYWEEPMSELVDLLKEEFG